MYNELFHHYFTTIASTLQSLGLMDSRCADNTRLGLSQLAKKQDSLRLEQVKESCPDLYHLCPIYIGETALATNLIRQQLDHQLTFWQEDLAELSQTISKKVELLFNRGFIQYRNNKKESYTLFSGILVDVLESLNSLERELFRKKTYLSHIYPPQGVPERANISIALQEAFSWPLGHGAQLCFQRENSVLHFMAYLNDSLGCLAKDFSQSLKGNLISTHFDKPLHLLFIRMPALNAKLRALTFDVLNFDDTWQDSLQEALLCLEELRLCLFDTFTSISESIRSNNLADPKPLTRSHLMLLGHKLLGRGSTPKTAYQLCGRLEQYCIKNDLSMSELSLLEASKISPDIESKSLQELYEIDNHSSLNHLLTQDKENILTRFQDLRKDKALEN